MAAAGPLAEADREPLREQLRRRAAAPERHRVQLEALDFAKPPGFTSQRPEARGADRAQFHAPARALLRAAWAATGSDPASYRRGARRATSARWTAGAPSSLAMGYALGGGSGWVLLTYVPRDGPADEPVRLGSQPGARGRHSDPRARHVRARLPHRLRRERHGLRRCVPAQHRLEGGRGRATRTRCKVAPPRPLVQKEFGDLPGRGRRGGEGDAGLGQAGAVHRCAARGTSSRAPRTSPTARPGATPSACRSGSASCRSREPVVVFCVYGFHVGCQHGERAARSRLRREIHERRPLAAWKAIGGPHEAL